MAEDVAHSALVDDYLARLDRALQTLPESERSQMIEDISGHIAESREAVGINDEASIRRILDQIGDPEEVAAEAGVSTPINSRGKADVFVPWLLLFGGFILAVGWIIGVVLLWVSPTWKRWEKALGTLVLPGGLVPLAVLIMRANGTEVCTAHGGPGIATIRQCASQGYMFSPGAGIVVFAFALVAPLTAAIYLGRCRRMRDFTA